VTGRGPAGNGPTTGHELPSRRYVSELLRFAAAASGRRLTRGTSVVADESRVGSRLAVAYAVADHTIVWCDPEVADRVAELAGPLVVDVDTFLDRARAAGGDEYGRTVQRVLDGPLTEPRTALAVRRFDPEDPDDLSRLTRFVALCSDDDLEDAELDLADLDPFASVTLDRDEILAYASARPWTYGPAFDDIAVITRPDARRGHRGAAAVAHLVRRSQAHRRLPLYRCDHDNLGSNRLAESLGFTIAGTLGAAHFADGHPPVDA
jgi:hypothetical protein